MSKNLFRILIVFLVVILNSCIIVVHEEKRVQEFEQELVLSPKPILKMSENIIRSDKGDMIAFLPDGWFLVNVESKVTPDIIAVAMNPDYTLSAVFSVLRNNELIKQIIEKEGLFGLARISLDRRENKTVGFVKQIGKYQQINMGAQDFVKYEYSNTGGALIARSAVYISTTGDLYEFSLVPVNVKNNIMPSPREFDDIFQSFLASINY
ncbi:MAG: hypothetical protein KIT33_08785 [Candidatus Kapabacteria bacterium]|nr:hypothetical protein [Ignavibacteriota bacterium]MCW5885051.1 hypothetical protein [Candidatus Kapabacteria bacterium]